MQKRQVVLDTETTGLTVQDGHRIIEIAGVELIDRQITGRTFHQYVCPKRDVEPAAFAVHGISTEFLADKPLFKQIVNDFLAFIEGAELVIHNASFDVGFLNNELLLAGIANKPITDYCAVLDTLPLARKKHPGQQNNLDALCKRYTVDNSHRSLHGALLDAHLLAAIYLAMTGGQISLFADAAFDTTAEKTTARHAATQLLRTKPLKIITADAAELTAHQACLEAIKRANGVCLWEE